MRVASAPKLVLAVEIFHVHSFVVFFVNFFMWQFQNFYLPVL